MARLSDGELKDLCTRLGVTKSGIDLVMRIRSSEPARRVGGGIRNVPVRYPSRKMGFIIQAESHKLELPHVLKMERDNNVLEFYDQPEAIKLTYQGKTGKKIAHFHHTDLFEISYDFIGYVEFKEDKELLKLSQAQPNRYCITAEDQWICPPGIKAAGEFGLSYEIRTEKDFTWAEIANIDFLQDY